MFYSLSLETSCDDTAVAILEHRSTTDHRVIAAGRSSQFSTHAPFGGVVPSLAARDHAANAPVLLQAVWGEAKKKNPRLTPQELKHISYTASPGLMPCLLVGRTVAETLAWTWQRPLLAVDHIAAHVASALAGPELKGKGYPLPAVALVVSGGHTSLFKVTSYNRMTEIGHTVDDAAGEAFDKVGRLLGLDHPAGPALEKLAAEGNPAAFTFPRPMLKDASLNFSFAGLKTAVLYTLRDQKLYPIPYTLYPNLAASFQAAAIDVLVAKTLRAGQEYKVKTIIVAGGVAANQALRAAFADHIKTLTPSPKLVIPPIELCADNAVMVAIAGAITA